MTDTKEKTEISLFKNHIEIGKIKRVDRGFEMSFLPHFIGNEVSYHIKATESPIIQQGVNLPPFLANLLPEGLRLQALIKLVKTSPDDLFSIFAAAGKSCIGDITCGDDHSAAIQSQKLEKTNFYELFENSIGQIHPEAISGVQEKISASMITFPIRFAKKKKSYLLKLNPKEFPSLIENEFHTMALARACGIETANLQLVEDQHKNKGLLVERFDRAWNDELKRLDFIHQEDGCQMLNIYPAEKYRVSINTLAKQIAELAPSPTLEILKLVRSVAFAYLVGSGDLHAKNVSMYDPPNRPRQLTPAYDVISTRAYGDMRLALKIDGKDDNLSKNLLLDFCARFEINPKASERMLENLIFKFSKGFAKHLKQIPLTEKQHKIIEQTAKKRMGDLA